MCKSPIIVSGLSGSGTRLLGDILQRSGVNMGQDLNESLDNLLFTLLFKRPCRFSSGEYCDRAYLRKCISIFERASIDGQRELVFSEIGRIIIDMIRDRYYGPFWLFKRLFNVWYLLPDSSGSLWGWKEPHAGYFFEDLCWSYPDGKFIILIRNGLDMAYASNDQQGRYWHRFFGMVPCRTPAEKLRYWYLYNSHIKKCLESAGVCYKIIRLEDLFLMPEKTLGDLFSFLELSLGRKIIHLPHIPNSFCRYRNFNLSWVNNDTYQMLSEFDYSPKEFEHWECLINSL